jgi:hypothetical protein
VPRPHEDRERHTLVDHRPGGPPVAFSLGTWCAVGVADVRAERAEAEMSAYETLVERARSGNAHAGAAAVLRSANGRRVAALVQLDGHDAFRHLAAAWDDHHLFAEHRAVAESISLMLYRVRATAGVAAIDTDSHDVFAFEHVSGELAPASRRYAAAVPATGFLGASLLESDDPTGALILYRFEHAAEIDAVAGPTAWPFHPEKTFV